MPLITAPGVYPAITSTQYFAEPCPAPALTCSTIKTLLYRTAAEAHYEHPALGGGKSADTAEKRFGDVAHQIALGKGRGYAICEFDNWMTKASKEAREEALANGLTPITRPAFEAASRSGAVMRQTFERYLASRNGGKVPKYETEVVFAWIEETPYGPIWCRMMADVWCESLGVLGDPKFTKVLRDGPFEGHAVKMGWDLQDGWYRRGVEKLFPKRAGRIEFHNFLVHPEPPHVYRVRYADEATRTSLRPIIQDEIHHFAACLYEKFWPGYVGHSEPWTAKGFTFADRAVAALEMAEDDA